MAPRRRSSLLVAWGLVTTLLAAPVTADITVFAAGDIAQCDAADPAVSAAAETARLIAVGAPVLVLGLSILGVA